jgi:hypothetical protein
MDPREFYRIAEKIALGSPSPRPAWCRTAIGRAYFGALNVAVDSLARLGVDCDQGPQKHGKAVAFLYASGDAPIKTASAMLDYLKSVRNHADYHLERTDVDTLRHARQAVERARDVISYLDEFEADPRRHDLVTQNIEAYIKKIRKP